MAISKCRSGAPSTWQRLRRRAAVAVVLSVGFGSAALSAQQPQEHRLPAGDGIHVRFVALDTFPFPGADAVILRQLDELPHDEVVIRRSALSIEVVQLAIRQLRLLHAAQGEVPRQSAVYRVGTGQGRGAPAAAPPRAIMEKDSLTARMVVWGLTDSHLEHRHPGMTAGRQMFVTFMRAPPPGSRGRPPQ